MAQSHKSSSFTLGEHDKNFINEMVTNGRFGNKTEVIRAGLRLLEDYEYNSKLQRLRASICEGMADIKAGRITAYDNADDLVNDIINKE